MKRQLLTFGPVVLVGGLMGALGGCSASGDGSQVPGVGSGANGGAGPNFGGSSGSGAGGLITGGASGSSGNGSGGSGPTCGGDRYDAQPRPLDVYVMFDDSGSMFPWWGPVTQAFYGFLNDPKSAGIGVGIQFFGQDCNPSYYANPRVAIAPLPQNAGPIQQSFPIIPIESTPTEPALTGALQHAKAWKSAHADHEVVVLLVSDGEPTECNSTLPGVVRVATDGLNSAPRIPTYVLGLGLNLTNLHQIAAAGGTNQAFIVDPNSGPALTNAMNQIRGAALPCDYALPNGGQVDPRKVNIEFTPGGANRKTIFNVGDAAGCDPMTGGWYYDNPAAPTRAIICPQTCNEFKAGGGGQVDVVLGCDTVIK